jgi:DNA primase large subunit
VLAETAKNYRERAVQCRSGAASANQDLNRQAQKCQSVVNNDNAYLNDKLERVSISDVQQVSDRAFFKRGERWIDSRLIDKGAGQSLARRVEWGSEEFGRLLQRLTDSGRAGCAALRGEVLLEVDGETLLLGAPRG